MVLLEASAIAFMAVGSLSSLLVVAGVAAEDEMEDGIAIAAGAEERSFLGHEQFYFLNARDRECENL